MDKELSNIDVTALAAVTNEDFKQFLMEVVKNHVCTSCSTSSWALVGKETEMLAILSLGGKGEFSLPPSFIPVMAVACNNCGFIRHHGKVTVANWKAAKAAAK